MGKHLIVIGGGAAGFFCAVNSARLNPSLEVTILEKSNKVLSKVKVSGGGRCNITHACFDINNMSKQYPRGRHFVKKAFHHFFTTDTVEWFEERGVKLKAEKDGRMFPVSDSSQSVIDCLMKEAARFHVSIQLNSEVKKLSKENGNFYLELTDFKKLKADYVCIATGGFPKSSMFSWLKETGHNFEEPVPSLFTFNLPQHPITKLMGISIEKAKVKILGTKLQEEGPLLITHWGLSGPVVLRLSAWGAKELAIHKWQFSIFVNWLPEYNEQSLQKKFQQFRNEIAMQKIVSKNSLGMPARLWEFFTSQAEIKQEWRWGDLPANAQNKLAKNICAFEFEVKGKTTFKEEFVTAGGIKLNEVDANTMMSKKVNRLFFAGEVLDVDGITGGFNFQHAWTSGWVAARAIAARL